MAIPDKRDNARAYRKFMRTKHYTGCSDEDRHQAVNHAIYSGFTRPQWLVDVRPRYFVTLIEQKTLTPNSPMFKATSASGSATTGTTDTTRPLPDTIAPSPGDVPNETDGKASLKKKTKKNKSANTESQNPENTDTIVPSRKRGRPRKAPGAPKAPYNRKVPMAPYNKKTPKPSRGSTIPAVQQPLPPRSPSSSEEEPQKKRVAK
ncbi:hypothetical protein PFICI_11246 [Pestalotiopsis fici W106-1]|uniref:Uncharacterized protein n=1 Tax=Pestalotiopsis fici (strain W106-1 / CGMCC3.15140) TaxID=1229662 RepID=W3WW82_PESFW|nr:uncharacterized protein PFICI_11246 [Pestalotiopsis fici W106-1]ETS77372.1 hypothetical protein PFICI_11246 [Pestalotiopsis fici W106-1]